MAATCSALVDDLVWQKIAIKGRMGAGNLFLCKQYWNNGLFAVKHVCKNPLCLYCNNVIRCHIYHHGTVKHFRTLLPTTVPWLSSLLGRNVDSQMLRMFKQCEKLYNFSYSISLT